MAAIVAKYTKYIRREYQRIDSYQHAMSEAREHFTARVLASVRAHPMKWAVVLFLGAFCVRMSVLALTFKNNESVQYFDDAQIALNILNGHGYSFSYQYRNWLFYEAVLKHAHLDEPVVEGFRTTAVKQPLYALVLTALFRVFGARNFGAVFVTHALASSLMVSVLFLCFQRTAVIRGVLLAVGAAIYPAFVVHAMSVPESTTLLLLLISALWLCIVRIHETASLKRWAAAGAIAGLAILTEPVTLPLVILSAPLGIVVSHPSRGRRLTGPTVAIVLSMLIVSPWLVRNYVVFNRFPVFKSGMGLVFNWGLEIAGNGSWIPEEKMVALEKQARSVTELQEDEAIRRELMRGFPSHWRDYILHDIPLHLAYLWWDVPRYWNNYSIQYMVGRRIPFILLFLLAVPQLWKNTGELLRRPVRTCERRIPSVAALILLFSFTGIYTVFGAFHSRYRLPLELALLVFASGTVAGWVEQRLMTRAEGSLDGGELEAALALSDASA